MQIVEPNLGQETDSSQSQFDFHCRLVDTLRHAVAELVDYLERNSHEVVAFLLIQQIFSPRLSGRKWVFPRNTNFRQSNTNLLRLRFRSMQIGGHFRLNDTSSLCVLCGWAVAGGLGKGTQYSCRDHW